MRLNRLLIFLGMTWILFPITGLCQDKNTAPPQPAATGEADVGDILGKIETHYAGRGFSAGFIQTSTIKALDITDHANGKVFIHHPGKMRWEYEAPEKQIILTDGEDLWVWRPDDRQVMTGKSADYFGGGKGAGFLSDIRTIKKQFTVSLENLQDDRHFNLKLVPREKKFDISAVYLLVSRDTYDVRRITSLNSYGDETRIELNASEFHNQMDGAMFRFTPGPGIDVLKLDG